MTNETNTHNSNKKNEKAFLDSLKKKTEEEIKRVRDKYHKEKLRIKDSVETEIESFREQNCRETEKLTAFELEKVKNRTSLEKRKARLKIIEEVTIQAIDEAIATLRNEEPEKYRSMIKENLSSALSGRGDEITICCNPEDRDLIKTLYSEMRSETSSAGNPAIEEEDDVTGGFRIIDHDQDLSVNFTFDRLVYRRMEAVRREVFSSIADKIPVQEGE